MDFEQLIGLADVKDRQALAMFDLYYGKVGNKELQELVDNYCNNMATSFIGEYQEAFNDQELNQKVKNYIYSIRADKPHSGHRFFEILYQKIVSLNKENIENEPKA